MTTVMNMLLVQPVMSENEVSILSLIVSSHLMAGILRHTSLGILFLWTIKFLMEHELHESPEFLGIVIQTHSCYSCNPCSTYTTRKI